MHLNGTIRASYQKRESHPLTHSPLSLRPVSRAHLADPRQQVPAALRARHRPPRPQDRRPVRRLPRQRPVHPRQELVEARSGTSAPAAATAAPGPPASGTRPRPASAAAARRASAPRTPAAGCGTAPPAATPPAASAGSSPRAGSLRLARRPAHAGSLPIQQQVGLLAQQLAPAPASAASSNAVCTSPSRSHGRVGRSDHSSRNAASAPRLVGAQHRAQRRGVVPGVEQALHLEARLERPVAQQHPQPGQVRRRPPSRRPVLQQVLGERRTAAAPRTPRPPGRTTSGTGSRPRVRLQARSTAGTARRGGPAGTVPFAAAGSVSRISRATCSTSTPAAPTRACSCASPAAKAASVGTEAVGVQARHQQLPRRSWSIDAVEGAFTSPIDPHGDEARQHGDAQQDAPSPRTASRQRHRPERREQQRQQHQRRRRPAADAARRARLARLDALVDRPRRGSAPPAAAASRVVVRPHLVAARRQPAWAAG